MALSRIAGGQATGHAANQGLHGPEVLRLDGGQLLPGEQGVAKASPTLAGVELGLPLHEGRRLDEQGRAPLRQPLRQNLVPRGSAGAQALDHRLQFSQAHGVQHPPGQQIALAGQADVAGADPRGGGLHRLGQGGLVTRQQLAGQLRRSGRRLARRAPRRPARRGGGRPGEEGVETVIEPIHLLGALGQGNAEGVLQQGAIAVADFGRGAVGVDRLGGRHAHVVGAQRLEEALQGVLHRLHGASGANQTPRTRPRGPERTTRL